MKLFTPVLSAVAVLPETLTVAPAAMAVGIAASRTGRYRWSLWAGWFLTTLGAGLLLPLGANTPAAAWIWLNLPVGVGTGMLFPALALSVQAASPPPLSGEAAAFFSFARGLGQAAGVAASGVLFQNAFRRGLRRLALLPGDVAAGYARDATAVVGVIKGMAPGPRRDELVGAFNGGMGVGLKSGWRIVLFSQRWLCMSDNELINTLSGGINNVKYGLNDIPCQD